MSRPLTACYTCGAASFGSPDDIPSMRDAFALGLGPGGAARIIHHEMNEVSPFFTMKDALDEAQAAGFDSVEVADALLRLSGGARRRESVE